MRERTIQTAAHLGLLEKLQMLESSILQIPGIPEVIMLPRYSIPASRFPLDKYAFYAYNNSIRRTYHENKRPD